MTITKTMLLDEAMHPPTHIDILPPELIRRIFIWAKVYDPSNVNHTPPSSVALSHVSRRWQTIALAYEELWANWPRYGRAEHWTDICYTRSLHASLELRIKISEYTLHPRASAGRELALGQISRARTISLEADFYHDERCFGACMDVLDALARSDAPLLESLSLCIANPYGLDRPVLIPQALFNDQVPPRLDTLINQNLAFLPSAKIWSDSIRVLVLKQASAWGDIDEMIDVLHAVAGLEELLFLYDDARSGKAPINYSRSKKHRIRSAFLPRLKLFELQAQHNGNDIDNTLAHASFVPGIFLFSYCALPSRTALYLGADILDDNAWQNQNPTEDMDDPAPPNTSLNSDTAEALALGAEALNAHFSKAAEHDQSYDVVRVNDRIIEPDVALQTSDSSDLPSELTLILPHVDTLEQRGRVSKEACSMYLDISPFRGTKGLHVTRIYAHPFLHHFPTFKALRVLFLSRKAVRDFVQAPRFSSYAERFPSLALIRFTDYDCNSYVLRPGAHPRPRRGLAFDDAMLDTLKECEEAGGWCQTWRNIDFQRCNGGDDLAEKIRADTGLRRFNERVSVRCFDSGGYRPGEGFDYSESMVGHDEDEDN